MPLMNWKAPLDKKAWGSVPDSKDPGPKTLSPKEEILLQLSAQNTAIINLQQTVTQQSATINKLQEVILELKTMITNISG